MGILDLKELTGGIMKSSVNMGHSLGRVTTASGGLTLLISA